MSSNVERKLAAIMFTDIVGFTSIMRKDESTGISILDNQESLIKPLLLTHKGNLVKRTGDGYLLEFSSSVNAVEYAMAMQDAIKQYNANEDNIEFHIRIGIHLGDIMIMGDDIIGDGVNVASRIEALASPDGICFTDAIYQSVKSRLEIDAKRIDEVDLKHIDDKYIIYKHPNTTIEDRNQTINHHESGVDINIENISKEPISIYYFFKNYLIFFIGFSLFGYIAAGLLWCFSYLVDLIPYLSIPNLYNTINRLDSDKIVNFYFFQIGTGELYLQIGSIIITFILTKITYRRIYKITFKDIRNVNMLIDILILQTGYKYVKQDDGMFIYQKARKDYAFSLVEFVLRIKYFSNFSEKLNSLFFKFDGNTVHIKAAEITTKRFLKGLNNLNK